MVRSNDSYLARRQGAGRQKFTHSLDENTVYEHGADTTLEKRVRVGDRRRREWRRWIEIRIVLVIRAIVLTDFERLVVPPELGELQADDLARSRRSGWAFVVGIVDYFGSQVRILGRRDCVVRRTSE